MLISLKGKLQTHFPKKRAMCWVASVVFDSLRPYRLYPARLLCPWDSPGKNTGVGCHALLLGIFPTLGWNLYLLCLLHVQVGSLPSTTWNSHTSGRDVGSISQSGRSPRVGNGNRLQYSCLENFMDRGAWQALVHGAAKNWTQFSDWTHTQRHLGTVSI